MAGASPLPRALRDRHEPRFGHDFSRVRIHTDPEAAASARQKRASAYTVGHDIVFGPGDYRPGTMAGERLVAHELTHVVQQLGGPGADDHLGISRTPRPLVQLAPSGATFSLDIDDFEAKVRRAIAQLAQVTTSEEETTFIFYSVPILSQIAVAGFSYLDSGGTFHPGSVLDLRFPTGTFSLSLVLDDTPVPAGGSAENGYFLPSGTTGRIALRLQGGLAQASDEEVANVLYHETVHLYSYLLRSGMWFRSAATGRTLTTMVRNRLSLATYATQIQTVEEKINSFLPAINQARTTRSVAHVTGAQVGEFARTLVEEAMVRAETRYFTSTRSAGPGLRGQDQDIVVSGGGSFLNTYLFRFGDMFTSADATAISGDTAAQQALREIQALLGDIGDEHFRARWGPTVRREQDLPESTPSLAPGFRT